MIRGLEGAADTNDGIVPVGELPDYAERQVEQISEKLFGQPQFPETRTARPEFSAELQAMRSSSPAIVFDAAIRQARVYLLRQSESSMQMRTPPLWIACRSVT